MNKQITRVYFLREVRKEIQHLLNEERDRQKAEANRKIWTRQQQQRIENVRNAIVSDTGMHYS